MGSVIWTSSRVGPSTPSGTHQEIVRKALHEQASRLLTASPAYHNRQELELSHKLCRLSGLQAATFCSSGAEAVETAIKLCRKWGRLHQRGAFGILSTHDAFHGRTLAAMSLSGKPGWDESVPTQSTGIQEGAVWRSPRHGQCNR
ncbi:MAG: aminotransferase class III-fold pyridoxal phosphate-dependent enzyme [Polyangiaceae bacterium]